MLERGSKYHLLVVEDEIGVRRSLIGKIRRSTLPLEISGEAENAEEAIEKIQQKTPDIILLDMRMPGMGGYHFLKILSKQYPHIKVIILSGHSDFEYVQQSLRSGAVDYLLKPLIFEELEEALKKTLGKIRLEREEKQRDIVNGMTLNQAVPLLKRQILNRILRSSQTHSAKDKLIHLNVNLTFEHYGLVVVRILDYEKVRNEYMQEPSTVFFVFENIASDSVKNLDMFICFPNEFQEDEMICLIGLTSKDSPDKELKSWLPSFQELTHNLQMYGNIHVRMVVSHPYHLLKNTFMAYQQVKERIQFELEQEGLFFLQDDQEYHWMMDIIPEDTLQSLISALKKRDTQALSKKVRSFLFEPKSAFRTEKHITCRQAAFAVYYTLEQAVDQLFAAPKPARGILTKWKQFYTLDSNPEKIYDLLISMSIGISELAVKQNSTNSRDIITQARRYVEMNYFEEITLEGLAKKFYLNQSYFSELFKKETGWTFKKFLSHIRMEKAKELLVEQNLRPSTVGELVGIKDPIYFSVLFKKMTGIPPGQYQQKHQ